MHQYFARRGMLTHGTAARQRRKKRVAPAPLFEWLRHLCFTYEHEALPAVERMTQHPEQSECQGGATLSCGV
ncbi:hypothetical protein NDU88_001614 [Pleurodeles waltl]|uniref:Uncharacterized protein n=1 Tax=Pleurodeles waltl TaxID=8319 RepID=A0AAV7SZY1_PLEWA|nr:hypothetical protein NDU88_001614 [Pleurodeles waltl]